jgi:hypothetical protein
MVGLHRLGMEHRKPKAISRKLDPAKQAAFIKGYEGLLNQLPADEAVIFAMPFIPLTRCGRLAAGRRKRSRSRWNRAADGSV